MSGNYIQEVKETLKSYIIDMAYADSIYFIKTDYSLIENLMVSLKLHSCCKFEVLYDLSAFLNPHHLYKKNKFTVYYYLSSLRYNSRLIVGIQLYNENFKLISMCKLFKSSIWLERETWDMFGIFFVGNADLRRILTDYGFRYNPMLKEYPLKGYQELKYYNSKAILEYIKVSDQQQSKIFDFKNPWKYLNSILS